MTKIKFKMLFYAIFFPVVMFAGTVNSDTLMHNKNFVLEKTIPLLGVDGRFDHFSIDVKGRRLFVAALGNNSVEVLNLDESKVIHSIRGLSEPQGLFYNAETNRLYVANGGDGTLCTYDGKNYALIETVKFGDDADNVRYDSSAKYLYVGYGSGALGAIDVTSGKIVFKIPLKAHPESFQLEKKGTRIFVNVPNAGQIAVIDREKKALLTTWTVETAKANFPMALDEANHRLFIGCRNPAQLLVFDTQTGKQVSSLSLHGDCDDIFYDSDRKQIYASCGEGFIDVISQKDANQYELVQSVKTKSGARTCFFDGQYLYLAVPKRGEQSAEIRLYRADI